MPCSNIKVFRFFWKYMQCPVQMFIFFMNSKFRQWSGKYDSGKQDTLNSKIKYYFFLVIHPNHLCLFFIFKSFHLLLQISIICFHLLSHSKTLIHLIKIHHYHSSRTESSWKAQTLRQYLKIIHLFIQINKFWIVYKLLKKNRKPQSLSCYYNYILK